MPVKSWRSKLIRKRVRRMPSLIRKQLNLRYKGWPWGLDVLISCTTPRWPFEEIASTIVLPYERQRFYALWTVLRLEHRRRVEQHIKELYASFLEVEPEARRVCRVALRDISAGVTYAYRLDREEMERHFWTVQ